MSDLKRKAIKVSSVEINNGETNGNKWVMIKLETTEKEYPSFFATKKDGSDSKAFTFYRENKSRWDDAFLTGDTIDIDIVYKENPYVDKQGQDRVGLNIVMFNEPESQPSNDEQIPPPSDEDEIDINSVPL